jgi:plastocyanin
MRASIVVLVLAFTMGGCGGDSGPTIPQRTATPLDLATTGTIRGEITFTGTPPPMRELPLKNFPGCQPTGPDPVLAGDALVANGRVQNAFVYVKSGLGERVFAVPATPVEVDQTGCVYMPRVVGAQVGQPILYKNSDPIMHNVHGTPTVAKPWNVSLANKGMTRSIQLDQAEVMVAVRCDVHPWMQSYVGIVDHPYFAVTGADGQFELKQVPAGEYTIGVWHEKFGTREAKATVTPQAVATVTVAFAPTPPN